MKKSLIALVCLFTLCISCEKKTVDPAVKEPVTTFTFNGEDFDLSKAALDYYGQLDEGEGYNFDLILNSDSVSLNLDESDNLLINGSGSIFYIELFSPSPSELSVGEYTYKDDYSANSFDYGLFIFKYNEIIQDGEDVQEITGGKVVVTEVIGNEYKLSFDFILEDGNTVKGTYEGVITTSDRSSELNGGRKSAVNPKSRFKNS